jgi:hypothetical protein
MGSAPDVESTRVLSRNIKEILNLAVLNDKSVDFHMDYGLKPISHPDRDNQPLLLYFL